MARQRIFGSRQAEKRVANLVRNLGNNATLAAEALSLDAPYRNLDKVGRALYQARKQAGFTEPVDVSASTVTRIANRNRVRLRRGRPTNETIAAAIG